MRPLEISFCLLLLPLVCFLLGGALPLLRLTWALCLLPLAVLAAHFVWEGPHWQMVPAYLAAVVLIFAALFWQRAQRTQRVLRTRRRWVGGASLFLIAASVGISIYFPMFRLPTPTGPYAVGTHLVYLVDHSRKDEGGLSPGGGRPLMVQAWYPAVRGGGPGKLAVYQRRRELSPRASYRSVLRTNSWLDAPVDPARASWPVLLFNPGWMGERTQCTYLTQELASHGFFVVAIDHTYYGGLVAFPDGRVANSYLAPSIGNFEHSTIAEQLALGNKYVQLEAEDDIFVLNQLQAMNADPASPWHQRLDLSRVAALGFSIGGAVAAQTAYLDPRVKAAANLDGWTFGHVMQGDGLAKPFLLIYEDESTSVPTPARIQASTGTDRMEWEVTVMDYDAISSSLNKYGGIRLFLSGATHPDFTDRTLYSPFRSLTGGGTMPPSHVHTVVDAYTLAFFDHVLNGTSEPLLEPRQNRFAGVRVEVFPWDQAGVEASFAHPAQ